jgi:hypothetical protein
MIHNKIKIQRLLNFDDKDKFYHLQILKRKKEHPHLGSNSYVVKTYYISSQEYLDNKWPEVIQLCEYHNARAYINLNRRSYEKIAFHLLRKVADQIMNKDFQSARKAYESVCGAYADEPNKTWIIDVDKGDEGKLEFIEFLDEVSSTIQNLRPYDEVRVKAVIPTKNGCHLIVSPFNLSDFKKIYPHLDVHKNNPTLVYIPG